MSHLLVSTTYNFFHLSDIDAQNYCTAICCDGTNAFIGMGQLGNAGGVLKIPLANFDAAHTTTVYAAGFFSGDIRSMWTDGTYMYVLSSGTGGTVKKAKLDGSSGSPASAGGGSFSNENYRVTYDEIRSVYYSCAFNADSALVQMTGADVTGLTTLLNINDFLCSIGPCRYQSNTILVGGNASNGTPYIWEYSLDTGHRKSIWGNGSSGAPSGSRYASPLHDVKNITSDADGRIYFSSDTDGTYSIDTDGTLAQVNGTHLLNQYIPARNEMLVCGGDYVIKFY